MKNLSLILEENKAEAIDLVKKQSGRIDFINVKCIIHNNPDDYEEDDFYGDLKKFNCPRVIISGCDAIDDCFVLSVVYDEKTSSLKAWIVDVITSGEIICGWYDCSFESYSDDDVYQHIYNIVNGIK